MNPCSACSEPLACVYLSVDRFVSPAVYCYEWMPEGLFFKVVKATFTINQANIPIVL